MVLVGMLVAIWIVSYLHISLVIASFIGAIILLLCAIFIKKLAKARIKLIIVIISFCLMLGITILNYNVVENREVYSQDSIIQGRINILTESDTEGLIEGGYYKTIYLDDISVDGKEISGKAQAVFIDGRILDGYKVGDIIEFKGSISPKNLNIDDSYSVYSHTDGIYHYISVSGEENEDFYLRYLGNDTKVSDKIKLHIKSVLYENTRSDTAGFLYAMTFGDKSGLESGIKDSFSYTGTAHIFAVSGLHVGIIAGALIFLLKKMRANHLVQFFVVGIILSGFCVLCEFSPSTLRATIMVMVMLFANLIMLRSDVLSNLSLAGVVLLIINPIYMFDLGFIMSFLAVYGLLTMSRFIGYGLRKIKVPYKLAYMLGSTLAVNMALMPVLLCYFGGQSLLFIIANLIILPLMGIIFPIYLAGLVLASILPFLGIILTLACGPFTAMIMIIERISQWKFLIIDYEISKAFILINVVIMFVLSRYTFIPYRAKKIISRVLCVVFCLGLIPNINLIRLNATQLHFYEDGNLCQYIVIDDSKEGTYLVVNGQTSKDGAYVTKEKLKEYQIWRIDGLVVVGECDAELVEELMLTTNCYNLYSFGQDDYSELPYKTQTAVFQEEFAFSFLGRGTLEVIMGDTKMRVMAKGYTIKDSDFDILVSYDIQEFADDNQYIICQEGYTNYLQNYMPSTFTIGIKNDKIRIPYWWRY